MDLLHRNLYGPSFWFSGSDGNKATRIHSKGLVSIVFIILGVTVLVYFLSNWAMRTVNPTLVGAYVYTQPVFATFIAVVFFGEMLSLQHISAAIMVFSGVYLVGKRIQ